MASTDGGTGVDIRIIEARQPDIPSLSTVVARAFHPVNPYIKKTFPDTQMMRDWWAESFEDQLSNSDCHLITAIDTSQNDEAVGLLCLRLFGAQERGAGTYAVQPLTSDHDAAAFAPMIDGMAHYREKLMYGTPHFCIELFAVDHGYAGKGTGKRLIQKACEIADEDGHECFVQANGSAKGYYERFGFVVKGREVMPGEERYEEFMLVRTAAKTSI